MNRTLWNENLIIRLLYAGFLLGFVIDFYLAFTQGPLTQQSIGYRESLLIAIAVVASYFTLVPSRLSLGTRLTYAAALWALIPLLLPFLYERVSGTVRDVFVLVAIFAFLMFGFSRALKKHDPLGVRE